MSRGIFALIALVGLAGCTPRPKAQRRGPFLSISDQGAVMPARRAVPPASIALALGGLPPEETTHLREYLAQSTDAAVRRAAPTLFDLGLDDADAASAPDPLRQALPDVPAWTAAANVLGAPWSTPGLSVKLGPTCADAAARCVPLFAAADDHDDALVRRGRALAWSLGNAALLRVPAASRAALLQSLRAAQTRPSSTIALVFGAPRGVLDEAELELLRDHARTALAHLPPSSPQRPWLDAFTAARASWELPITFDADEVLVIPRLSALARLQEFQAEVALAGGSSEAITSR
jgi:hypothetical protein